MKPLSKEDDVNLFELHSDSEVMKFIRKPDQDIFETKKRINSLLKYTQSNANFGLWTVWSNDKNEFLGWAILQHIELNADYPIEVGYRLHKKFWNNGLATQMTLELLAYAKELGLENISAITLEENEASKKVLEKTGFKYLEDRLYYQTQALYYEKAL